MALAFLGVWVIVGHLLDQGARAELEADLASFADVQAQRLLPGLREAVERRAGAGGGARRAALFGRQGETLAGDPTDLPEAARAARGEPRRVGRWLAAGRTLPGGFALVVAHDRARDDALSRALALALAGLGLVAGAFGVAGGLVAGRGALARVEEMNAALARAAAGDLTARAPAQGSRDEFATLAGGVNAALDRLAALVAGLKAVAERIAHEMRSPLAHLGGGLDDARRAAQAGEAGPALAARIDDLRAEVEEINAVFGALLDVTLAEAAAGDPRGLAPVDLGVVLAEMSELYEAPAEERGVRLTRSGAGVVVALGDRHLLSRLIANLIDNAVKFSPQGGGVETALETQGERFSLSVRDHGPGLPQGFADKAFELFSRAPQAAATPGHGLGLALARAIATRHGMRLTLENAAPGLRVTLSGRVAPK
jgi:signal transduction histidine kinase